MGRRIVTFVALFAGALSVVLFFACGGKIAPLDDGPPVGAGVTNPASTAPDASAAFDASLGADSSFAADAGGDASDASEMPDIVRIPLPPLDADLIPQCVDYWNDPDGGAVSDAYPAYQPSMAQVVDLGGPTMGATPTVVPIAFSSDVLGVDVVDFTKRLGASDYWGALGAEYGFGRPQVVPVITDELPLVQYTDGQIVDWLYAHLDGTHPEFPPISPTTLYVFIVPAGTKTTGPDDEALMCGAYHYQVQAPGKPPITYAVVTDCYFDVANTVRQLTKAVAGAMTDPQLNAPAWAGVDYDHFMWAFFWAGGPNWEVTDPCGGFNGAPLVREPDLAPYAVERFWSDKRSLGRHTPCAPAPADELYVAAVPVTKDKVHGIYAPNGGVGRQEFHTRGVVVPPGTCRTIEIDLLSDRDPGAPILVDAFESSALYPRCNKDCVNGASVRASWNKKIGYNGEKLYLTAEVFVNKGLSYSAIIVTASSRGHTTWWPLVLGSAADKQ